jgi:hypothetical protein
VVLVVLAPLNLLPKRRPEDMGLEPDGDRARRGRRRRCPAEQRGGRRLGRHRVDAGARHAHRALLVDLRRLLLRAVSPGTPCRCHQTKYLVEIGFSASHAAWALGFVSLAGIPGQIALGYLSDRVGREWVWTVGSLGFVVCYVALLLLQQSPTPALLYLMVLAQGVLGYGLTSVIAAIPAEIFQGKHYGTIFGVLMLAAIGGGAPPVPGSPV